MLSSPFPSPSINEQDMPNLSNTAVGTKIIPPWFLKRDEYTTTGLKMMDIDLLFIYWF